MTQTELDYTLAGENFRLELDYHLSDGPVLESIHLDREYRAQTATVALEREARDGSVQHKLIVRGLLFRKDGAPGKATATEVYYRWDTPEIFRELVADATARYLVAAGALVGSDL